MGSTLAFPVRHPVPGAVTRDGGISQLVAVPDRVTVVLQQRDALGAQVKGSQPILVPSLWASIDAAYLSERAAELNTESVRREILLSVAQQYLGAVGSRR